MAAIVNSSNNKSNSTLNSSEKIDKVDESVAEVDANNVAALL